MQGTEYHSIKKATKLPKAETKKRPVKQEPQDLPSIEWARPLHSGNVLVPAANTQKGDCGFEFIVGLGQDETPLSEGHTSEVFEVKANILWSSNQANHPDFTATEKVSLDLPIVCLTRLPLWASLAGHKKVGPKDKTAPFPPRIQRSTNNQ